MEKQNEEYQISLISGEPEGWQDWPSVKNMGFPVSKVCPNVWDGVFLYSNDIDRFGFLTKEKVLTPPIFAKHYRLISEEDGIVAIVSGRGNVGNNNWVLIDLVNNKTILSGYAASFNYSEDLLAFRVDEKGFAWPLNMKWGLLNYKTGQVVMQPTSLPFEDLKENYVPVQERIRAHLEKVG